MIDQLELVDDVIDPKSEIVTGTSVNSDARTAIRRSRSLVDGRRLRRGGGGDAYPAGEGGPEGLSRTRAAASLGAVTRQASETIQTRT
jgi:hypothetical protein